MFILPQGRLTSLKVFISTTESPPPIIHSTIELRGGWRIIWFSSPVVQQNTCRGSSVGSETSLQQVSRNKVTADASLQPLTSPKCTAPPYLCYQLFLDFQLLGQLVLPLFEGDAAAASAVFDPDAPVVYLLQEVAGTQLVFNAQHSGSDGEDGDRETRV